MKLFISLLSAIVVTNSFSQEFVKFDFPLKTKTANLLQSYIFEDGTIQVTASDYIYLFGQDGKLLKEPSLVPKESILQLPKNSQYNGSNLDSKIFYNFYRKSPGYSGKAIFDIEHMIPEGKEYGHYEVSDGIKINKNSLNSAFNYEQKSSSEWGYESEDGTVYGINLFVTISDQSHPNLKRMDKKKFYTFLHIVEYDTVTKESKISNALIDKVSFPRGPNNKLIGKILGVVDGKAIVLFETFVDTQLKGIYKIPKSPRKKTFTYWSVDLETKEEKELYTYEVDIPEQQEEFYISHKILTEYGTLVTDLSWTEKMNVSVEGKNESAYTSHHKLLVMGPDMQFSELKMDMPTDVFLLLNSSPSMFQYYVDDEQLLNYCNVIRVTEEAEKRRDNKDHYAVYIFQVNDSNQLSNSYNYYYPNVSSLDGVKIFLKKGFTEEELENMYGNLFDADEICKLCNLHHVNIARIVGNELIVCTIDYLPEHTCSYGHCKIEKIMMRIGKIPLSE